MAMPYINNAWIASKVGAAFWHVVFRALRRTARLKMSLYVVYELDICETTGPAMFTAAVKAARNGAR